MSDNISSNYSINVWKITEREYAADFAWKEMLFYHLSPYQLLCGILYLFQAKSPPPSMGKVIPVINLALSDARCMI